nr:olfactory receptor 14I1-like [Dasypus novemcinctus]
MDNLTIFTEFLLMDITTSRDLQVFQASLSNLLMAMFYSMVPPLINPIIYSLRNREINNALGRMFHRSFELQRKKAEAVYTQNKLN